MTCGGAERGGPREFIRHMLNAAWRAGCKYWWRSRTRAELKVIAALHLFVNPGQEAAKRGRSRRAGPVSVGSRIPRSKRLATWAPTATGRARKRVRNTRHIIKYEFIAAVAATCWHTPNIADPHWLACELLSKHTPVAANSHKKVAAFSRSSASVTVPVLRTVHQTPK
jgi:hypothetical protein